MNIQLLNSLADICSQKGISHAVLCPGSRSAPLTLAILRSNKFICRTFSDERSAAFIALGIAQQTRKPVILVCTSGSAAYNFAPAIAEAYFQQVPLIVFTADRPSEWIDQLDGQTIRQHNLYGNHIKRFFELSVDDPHPDAGWHAGRIVNEAINLSISGIHGPVQINVPLREPLYSTTKSEALNLRVIAAQSPRSSFAPDQVRQITGDLSKFNKILIVPGQMETDTALGKSLEEFHAQYQIPFAGDILSNLHSLEFFNRHTDTFLGQLPSAAKEKLKPDLIITFGKSLVAKNLKLFLRSHKPTEHWHVQQSGEAADTFQSLTKIVAASPLDFFNQVLTSGVKAQPSWKSYNEQWKMLENRARESVNSFFDSNPIGEFHLVHQVIQNLPKKCNLHLANSMSVRYANHIGLDISQAGVNVFSNRGTSGIDGCTSTAAGHALVSDIPNILITGDQAFFYDRNAFWHNYPLPNLHVVVLNNHGGIIFNLIDGPAGMPEAEEYFITRQALNAKNLASEFGFSYQPYASGVWPDFFAKKGSAKILELESTQAESKTIFEEFKSHIRKAYEK